MNADSKSLHDTGIIITVQFHVLNLLEVNNNVPCSVKWHIQGAGAGIYSKYVCMKLIGWLT